MIQGLDEDFLKLEFPSMTIKRMNSAGVMSPIGFWNSKHVVLASTMLAVLARIALAVTQNLKQRAE